MSSEARNNPFHLMLSGKSYSDVLNSIIAIGSPELDQVAVEVREEEIPEIATYTFTTCQLVGTQKTLVMGGLLSLFCLLVNKDGRRELFDNMLEDLGLSRTQAYRSVAAWNCFGAELLNAPKVRKFFCSESLKILSEERTPAAAREEALARARDGEKITIRRAEALQEKHGVVPVHASVTVPASPGAARKGSSKVGRWLFAGAVVRIQVTPTAATETPDIPAVIRDLEAAIAQLRNGQSQLVA